MNKSLEEQLNKVMTHIRDAKEAFGLCANPKEVDQVIKKIPSGFGQFEVDDIDENGFTIVNSYFDDDDPCTEQFEEYDFGWFEAPDLKNDLLVKDCKIAKEHREEAYECGHNYDPADFVEFLEVACDDEEYSVEKYNIAAFRKAFDIELGY